MIDKTAFLQASSANPSVRPGGSARGAGLAQGDDFASLVSDFFSQAVNSVGAGEAAAAGGIAGKVPVQEVVDKVMAAEQSLQAAIAVRDKIVSAYLEVSRMNI